MTENDNTLIQRFFDFDLNDQELQSFNNRMETDDIFLKKIRLYRYVSDKVDGQFNKAELAQKRKLLQKWKTLQHEEVDLPETKPVNIKWLGIAKMAAAFLLLAIAAFWLFEQTNLQQKNSLAMEYWEATNKEHVATSTTKSGGIKEVQNENLIKASEAYNQNYFAKALDLLNSISATEKNFDQVLFLKGQCNFKLGNLEKTIRNFQEVIDGSGGQKDLAIWFQALAYLEKGETIPAKENLNFLIKEKYPIAEKAKALLEEL